MTTSSVGAAGEWPVTWEEQGRALRRALARSTGDGPVLRSAFCEPTPGFNYSSLTQLQIYLFKRIQF